MLLESFFSPMVGAGDNSLREQVFLEFCNASLVLRSLSFLLLVDSYDKNSFGFPQRAAKQALKMTAVSKCSVFINLQLIVITSWPV